MTFYKIKNGRNFADKPYWVTESINQFGEIWINMRGGWCMKSDSDEIVSVAEYPDEDEFIKANRKDVYSYLIKSKSEYGWLAPDGTFYGCDYASHSDVAEFYFNKDEIELENEGWIKIFRSVELNKPVFCQNKMSSKQRIWIEDHNVKYHYC